MTEGPKPLVAGNWKMNGFLSSRGEISRVARALAEAKQRPACDVLLCLPATLLAIARTEVDGSGLMLGAQDCHFEPSGAHTGDISAEMLADAGATAVIVGHSERRTDHGERNSEVAGKAAAAHRAGLTAIVCIGETAEERLANRTLSVISEQLRGSLPKGVTTGNTVIAYEPVWAIGTGQTPTPEDVLAVHGHIRGRMAKSFGEDLAAGIRILYGGSVKPANAAELMALDGVDGALVGGASLKADDFLGILAAYSS